jgi:hypothetical protein
VKKPWSKKNWRKLWASVVAKRKSPKQRTKSIVRQQMAFARRQPVTLASRFVPEDWR